MSKQQGSANEFINQLVVKAIEKKKKYEQSLAEKNKPRLEHVLFSQFDVLDTIESKNTKTTLYHLAKKGEPEKQICCKVLNENAPEYARSMFIAEATHLEVSQHPSTAEFIKLGNEFDRPYFMYKWIKGESLSEKLSRHNNKGFRHDHVAWLIYQLAGALEYMHTKGVCHLDIKPSNIIVCEDDGIKLIDFGAAQYSGEGKEYSEASLSYASPLFLETGKSDPQDDVYSMAILTCCLFIGYTENSDWKAIFTQRKRPYQIPKSVWLLLRLIVKKPRGHKLTPIAFAQALAKIDIDAMRTSNHAPIFTRLRNADLVLRKENSFEPLRLGMFKYLEVALIASVLVITGAMLSSYLLPQTAPVIGTSKIKPAQMAAFLTKPPWEITTALDDNEADLLALAPYREAVDVKNNQIEFWYNKEKDNLMKRRESEERQRQELSSIRKDMVALNDHLNRNAVISSSVNRRLSKLMKGLNNLMLERQKYTYSLGKEDQALADIMMSGDSKDVEKYLRTEWMKTQAESYFYAYVLPKEILNKVFESVNKNAENHFYSKAIDEINQTITLFGDTVELTSKKTELIIERSEYVLFGTVTGELMFKSDKLNTALSDLHENAPSRFKEVSLLLKNLARESLEQSFQQDVPAEGALAIEKALNTYQKQVTL